MLLKLHFCAVAVSILLTFPIPEGGAEDVPKDLPKNYVVNDGGKCIIWVSATLSFGIQQL